MRRQVLLLTTCALILAYGATAANAQGPMTPDQHHPQQAAPGQEGSMGPGGMMGRGTMGGMGGRMMGGGMMMGPPIMMRMIFALLDADGDGTISLQEFQAAHEHIFKAMDTDPEWPIREVDIPDWQLRANGNALSLRPHGERRSFLPLPAPTERAGNTTPRG